MSQEFFEKKIQEQIDTARELASHYKWEFQERTPARHSIGDFVRAVLLIDSDQDALAFYEGHKAVIQS